MCMGPPGIGKYSSCYNKEYSALRNRKISACHFYTVLFTVLKTTYITVRTILLLVFFSKDLSRKLECLFKKYLFAATDKLPYYMPYIYKYIKHFNNHICLPV